MTVKVNGWSAIDSIVIAPGTRERSFRLFRGQGFAVGMRLSAAYLGCEEHALSAQNLHVNLVAAEHYFATLPLAPDPYDNHRLDTKLWKNTGLVLPPQQSWHMELHVHEGYMPTVAPVRYVLSTTWWVL